MALKKSYRRKYSKKNSNATKKDVRKMIRSIVPKSEVKYFDQQSTGTAPFGSFTCFSICNAISGSGPNSYIGSQFTARYLNIRINITRATTATALVNRQRTIIFRDTQPDGSTATLSDILDSAAGDPMLYFRNISQTKRFKVYYDRVVNVYAFKPMATNKTYIRLKNIVKPNPAGGVPLTNGYFILTFNDAADTVNQPDYSYQTRLGFTDE